MTKNTNQTALIVAAQDWRNGNAQSERGTARAIVGLAEIISEGVTLTAKVAETVKGGGKRFRNIAFTLDQYAFPATKDDGKVDGALRSAMLTAICSQLFGEPEEAAKIAPAVKTGFARAFPAAMYLTSSLTLGNVSVSKGGHLTNVPLSLALDLQDDEGNPNARYGQIAKAIEVAAQLEGKVYTDDEIAAKVSKMRVTCDGVEHPVFGKLPTTSQIAGRMKQQAIVEGWIPAPTGRDRQRTDNAGEVFSQSLTLISNVLATIAETDESDVAFTREIEDLMGKVADQLVGYLARR
jgi:hypothetical protein